MNIAVILAAGSSKRFAGNKLFLPMGGRPLIAQTVLRFQDHKKIGGIVIVVSKGDLARVKKIFVRDARLDGKSKILAIITGGETRQLSSEKAIKFLAKRIPAAQQGKTKVLIHNSGNPMVTAGEIDTVLKMLDRENVFGCGVGRPIAKTIKCLRNKTTILWTPDRSQMCEMETPQAATLLTWKQAHAFARKEKLKATDDLIMIEAMGGRVKVVQATEGNRKITDRFDFYGIYGMPSPLKFGFAEDAHAFARNTRPTKKVLKLGGVSIPQTPQLAGDSDADVILHALGASLLNALGEKTFGEIATPMARHGIKNSAAYLKKILAMMRFGVGSDSSGGFKLMQIQIIIEAGRPRLVSHIPKIRTSLARLSGIPETAIGIQVHSGDGLSPYARGEGIRTNVLTILSIAPSCAGLPGVAAISPTGSDKA